MKSIRHFLFLAIAPLLLLSCSKSKNDPKGDTNPQNLAGLNLQQKINVAGNGYITIATLQNDGKLVVATDKGLLRINADGTSDNSFNPHVDIKNIGEFCSSLTAMDDGKILAGFRLPKAYADVGYRALYRLNSDGSIDNSFVVNIQGGHLSTTVINATLPLSDGSVIVAGNFYKTDGVQNYHLTKLSSTGRYVAGFSPNIVPESLNDFIGLYQLPNNKFMATGSAYTNSLLSPGRQHAIIFNNNGTVDESFNFTEEMYVEFPAPRMKMVRDVEQLQDGTYLFTGDLDDILHIGTNGQKTGNTEFRNQINSIAPIGEDKFLLGSAYTGAGSLGAEYKEFLSVYDKKTGKIEHASLDFDEGKVLQILKDADNSFFIIGDFYKGSERYHILKLVK